VDVAIGGRWVYSQRGPVEEQLVSVLRVESGPGLQQNKVNCNLRHLDAAHFPP
jgi:hypothetical protein